MNTPGSPLFLFLRSPYSGDVGAAGARRNGLWEKYVNEDLPYNFCESRRLFEMDF